MKCEYYNANIKMGFGNCVNCDSSISKWVKEENYKCQPTEDITDLFWSCRSLLPPPFQNFSLSQQTFENCKMCSSCTELLNNYFRSRKQFLQLCKPSSRISRMLRRNDSDAHQFSAPKTINSEVTKSEGSCNFNFVDSNVDPETILPDEGKDNEFNPVNGLIKQETDMFDYKEQFIKLEIEKLSFKSLANQNGLNMEKCSKDESNLYRCLKCTRIFSEADQLEKHKSSVHVRTENNFKCTFCPQTFSTAWFFRNHLNASHNGFEIVHYCQICKDKFYCEKDLQEHVLTKHDIRKNPYKCKNCTNSFVNVTELRAHLIAIHKGTKEAVAAESNMEALFLKKQEQIKRCNFCEKICCNLPSLRLHFVFRHADENYDCEVCHTEFSGYKAMTQHRRESHKNCPTCEMEFPNYSKMNSHFHNVHLLPKDRPFECEICGQRYPIYGRLQNHYYWHAEINGPKHFCQICDKAFPLKSHLAQHLKSAHSEIKRQHFKCQFCEKICSSRSNLNNHLRLKHSTNLELKFPCSICGQKFESIKSCSTHARIHTSETNYKQPQRDKLVIDGKVKAMLCYSSNTFLFTCPICGKSCVSQTNFFRHLKRAHLLKGIADPNIKATSIINCPTCDKAFSRKDLLDKHNRNIHGIFKISRAPRSVYSQSKECPHCGKLIKSNITAFRAHVSRHEIFIVEDAINNPDSKKELRAFYNEEDRSFKCHVCKSTFKKQSKYLSHVTQKSHSTKVIYNSVEKKSLDLPFKCDECPGLQYSTAMLLHRHKLSHRFRKDRIRKCNICKVTLRSVKYLKLHMQTQH